MDESSRFAGVVCFFENVPCRHSCVYIRQQRVLQLVFPNSSIRHSVLQPQREPKPHTPLLDHPKPLPPDFLVPSAMALSRIHLPSISSVLTSNRVFHPGHSVATKLDMDSTLPSVPDHLMVCPVVILYIGLLSIKIPTENYPTERISLVRKPGLLN